MTDQRPPDEPGTPGTHAADAELEGPRDEAISAFFDEQLRSVQTQSAGDDRWEQIVHEAGRPRRRPWWGLAAGTAAALAIGTAAWSIQQSPFGDEEVTKGDTVQATQSAFRPPQGVQPRVSERQPARGVDPSFITWSLSNAGSGTLYALGGSECDPASCPTLLRSTDNGTSWQTVHAFDRTDTSGVIGNQLPRIQPDRAITEVRFANPRVGYVFAGDLWVTQDRGQKFTQYAHPGRTVLDVEIHQDAIIVLTSDSCSDGQCDGSLTVSRLKPAAPGAAAEVLASRPFSGRLEDAQLVVRGADILVQPMRADGSPIAPWRLDGTDLVDVLAPTCTKGALQSLTATANGGTTLFAACGGEAEGDNARYSLQRSADQGRTWQAAPASLLLPRTGRLNLAAVDDQHIVAAVGGPRATRGGASVSDPSQTLQVTADGGKTWRAVTSATKASASGFDWAASPGGSEVYAIPRTTTGYWRSVDQGRTWSVVNPTGPPPTASVTSSPAQPTSRR